MKLLRKLDKIPKNIPAEKTILINNKIVTLDKVTCKDFYWHLINLQKHKPNNIKKWCDQFQNFENASEKTWPRIFKLPFSTLRNTKIQTFQYKILHRVISCNKWLYNIKINESAICNCCNEVDNIPHFFQKCSKVKEFWNMMINWLEQLRELNLKNILIFNECIIFGFPDPIPETREKIHVINFCIFYIKYYI